jgi:hypothetical protein
MRRKRASKASFHARKKAAMTGWRKLLALPPAPATTILPASRLIRRRRFRLSLLWVVLLTTPLIFAVQPVSAVSGAVGGIFSLEAPSGNARAVKPQVSPMAIGARLDRNGCDDLRRAIACNFNARICGLIGVTQRRRRKMIRWFAHGSLSGPIFSWFPLNLRLTRWRAAISFRPLSTGRKFMPSMSDALSTFRT